MSSFPFGSLGFILTLLVIPSANAQSPGHDIEEGQIPPFSDPPSRTATATATTTTLRNPSAINRHPPSRTITATPRPTAGLLPPYYTPDYQPLTSDEERSDKLVNLYFLLLALGIILIVCVTYFYRKRRKSKGARVVQRGQVALRRDLEQGGWRMGGLGRWTGSGPAAAGRREEGLDERGEAPPPYAPPLPGEGHVGAAGPGMAVGVGEAYELPRMPQRAVVVDEVGGLPRYDDVASIPADEAVGGQRGPVRTTAEVVNIPAAVGTGLPGVHVPLSTA